MRPILSGLTLASVITSPVRRICFFKRYGVRMTRPCSADFDRFDIGFRRRVAYLLFERRPITFFVYNLNSSRAVLFDNVYRSTKIFRQPRQLNYNPVGSLNCNIGFGHTELIDTISDRVHCLTYSPLTSGFNYLWIELKLDFKTLYQRSRKKSS